MACGERGGICPAFSVDLHWFQHPNPGNVGRLLVKHIDVRHDLTVVRGIVDMLPPSSGYGRRAECSRRQDAFT